MKVNKVETANETQKSDYLQEFISPGSGKSNTIKYATGKKESFLIKNLTITGSVESNVIVRLNLLRDIFGDNKRQQILKEFYYYHRNNISETHNLNIMINSEGVDECNEFYVDIQKIVKKTDDKGKMDTLSFTLNGIKFSAP